MTQISNALGQKEYTALHQLYEMFTVMKSIDIFVMMYFVAFGLFSLKGGDANRYIRGIQ